MLTASQTNDDEGPSSSVRRAVPNSGQVPIGDKDYWLDVALRQLSVQRSNFIDAVRLVVSGKFIRDRRSILSFWERHNLFASADRCDAFGLERRLLTTPNRPHPVRKIGDLLIAKLVLEGRHRLHPLEPRKFLSRNTVKHRMHQIACIAQTKRGVG
jgi:hypothetical protein